MRLILGSIVIIVAGFSVNKYVFSSKVYDGVTTVTDIVAIYPVNIFDFKQTLQNYAYHLCYKNEDRLSQQHVTSHECVDSHDSLKRECEDKVFRLAPLNLQNKEEVLNYAKQYTQCTLPYKYIIG